MSKTPLTPPLALALGTALTLGAGNAGAASLFQTAELSSGYAVALAGDPKDKDKAGEHACGEGGCGGDMGATADDKADAKKAEADAKKPGHDKPADKKSSQ